MMIKELLTQKQSYLNHFFEKVDLQAADALLQALLQCRGSLVFTGVGKSGLVARKIALTMTSTGSRAFYLSPTDALHGDFGLLSPNDCIIMVSKSGESDELLNLIPFLRNRHIPLFSIVSNQNSRLAQASDCFMTLPVEKELCPFNLAPTTSTSIQLIFGDVLAIALMRHRSFDLDQYAMNHPGGLIGKKITLKVQNLMLTKDRLPLCKPQNTLAEVLVELSDKRCGCILIVDENMILQGIFTDGDLRRALVKDSSEALKAKMQALMTPGGRHIGPDVSVYEALEQMEGRPHNPITCLPVVDAQKKLLGLIRLHDILQSGLGIKS